MIKRVCVMIFLILFFPPIILSEETAGKKDDNEHTFLSLFSISLIPSAEFPFRTGSHQLLNVGGAGDIKAQISSPGHKWFAVQANLSYTFLPVMADTSISLISVSAGPGFILEMNRRFIVSVFAAGGVYYGFFNSTQYDLQGKAYENPKSPYLYFSAGLGVEFYVTPSISLGVNGSYHNYYGLAHSARGGIELNLHFDGFKEEPKIKKIVFYPVFPSLYQYYKDHSPGTVSLYNNERFTMENIKLSVSVDHYMEPTPYEVKESLNPGENKDIKLNLFFSSKILDITVKTSPRVVVKVEYTLNGRKKEQTSDDVIECHDRNGIRWDDDKKAASFITNEDPEIRRFSGNIPAMVKDEGPSKIDENLRIAMALFEKLKTCGIQYVLDPTRPPFTEAHETPWVIDFLQFPGQTLDNRGGDCDDLSILFCSLLEAIGIETALITIPGHIFMAFMASSTNGEKHFRNQEDIIIHNEKAWIPVETTKIQEGFLKAWEWGAEEWRKGVTAVNPKEKAVFFTVNEAWKRYMPAGYLKEVMDIPYPDDDEVRACYIKERNRVIEREIQPKVIYYTEKIKNEDNPAECINQLGIIYTEYGLFDKAEKEFLKLINEKNDEKIIVRGYKNLGYICMEKQEYEKAIEYYSRAYVIKPYHKTILIHLIKANYELGNNYEAVNEYFKKLEIISPKDAEKLEKLFSKEIYSEQAHPLE